MHESLRQAKKTGGNGNGIGNSDTVTEKGVSMNQKDGSKNESAGKSEAGKRKKNKVGMQDSGKAAPPVLTEEEIRKQKINQVSDMIEEAGKYASAPAVQRKLRELYGEGMSQPFVHEVLATRRQLAKLQPWLATAADSNEPLLTDIQRIAEGFVKSTSFLLQRARSDERQFAEAGIKKAQQDASTEIARIEQELNDYMEDNERLTADFLRMSLEIKRLEALEAEMNALPKLSLSVEEKLNAILDAFADKAVMPVEVPNAEDPVSCDDKPTSKVIKSGTK